MPATIAFVFPGQGSHRAGMVTALGPAGRAVVDGAGRAAGLDLARLGDDADACSGTAVGQPAIFATSIAALAALREAGVEPDVVAGHSLGEVTAAVAAGVLSVDDGARLVAERGRAMGDACQANPGGMAAIVRLEVDVIATVLADHPEVAIANNNAPGQVVVAGPDEDLAAALEALRAAGGRAIPLKVEGAFHSSAMAPAVVAVDRFLARTELSEPTVPLVTGVTGTVLQDADAIARNLVDGILAPVRWVDVHQRLVDLGIDVVVEVGPGGVLAGLARRAGDVTVHAVATADEAADVAAALVATPALVSA